MKEELKKYIKKITEGESSAVVKEALEELLGEMEVVKNG